ncbi:hypothetical protein HB772_19835 [Sinorhizobium meliloti]|nr:hypothetical protein HB772_19835 [Sinorhizobium meliloti]
MLSAQEIRNCSSRMVDGGEHFYSVIQNLANEQNFLKAIERLPDPSRERRGDEELVLRFFAVKNYRDGYKGNIEEWLNSYMEDVLLQHHAFAAASESGHFNRVFNLISAAFMDGAFSRFKSTGDSTGRLAPAYFEAVVGAVSDELPAIEGKDVSTLRAKLIDAFAHAEFLASTGPGANSIEKFRKRIDVVKACLLV